VTAGTDRTALAVSRSPHSRAETFQPAEVIHPHQNSCPLAGIGRKALISLCFAFSLVALLVTRPAALIQTKRLSNNRTLRFAHRHQRS
jgi:hypothetical protein